MPNEQVVHVSTDGKELISKIHMSEYCFDPELAFLPLLGPGIKVDAANMLMKLHLCFTSRKVSIANLEKGYKNVKVSLAKLEDLEETQR